MMLTILTAWHWLSIALILLIAELLTGSGFLLWIAVSAAITCLLAMLDLASTWQILIFSLSAIGSCVGWWFYRRYSQHKVHPHLNRRGEQYIGRIVTLAEAVTNGQGRVHLDDSYWRVEGEDLPAGETVRITGVDGIIFKVEKA